MVFSNPHLVTVVITTYNHGQYISKAIQSVENQTFKNIEILIIDDGSTDDTKEMIKSYPNVIYFRQENAGLSNARNTGIRLAKGEFINFLDADDWLYPQAVENNLKYLKENDKLAFVSGNHFKIMINENSIYHHDVEVNEDHFLHFLKGNYIGMHATVMYNAKLLRQFSFDESLRTCEDYDIYLKISKTYPVAHHQEINAAYRLHSNNMSSNYLQMLDDALKVSKRHCGANPTSLEKKAFLEGQKRWINFYTKSLYWQKLRKGKPGTKDELAFLAKYNKHLYLRYLYNYLFNR